MRGIGVLILPLGIVSPEVLGAIRSDLIAHLDCGVTVGNKLPLPMHGYVRQRKQYLSCTILRGLEWMSDGCFGHTMGLDHCGSKLGMGFGNHDIGELV